MQFDKLSASAKTYLAGFTGFDGSNCIRRWLIVRRGGLPAGKILSIPGPDLASKDWV
ncbi:MAG: hypothetical protein Q8N95_06495 [Desulfobacterales bacterium]|nr:hypothetical protein [Desulfobacterales bacterium]